MNTNRPFRQGTMLYRAGVPRTSRYVWFTGNSRVAQSYRNRNRNRVNKTIFAFPIPMNNMKFINIRNPEFVQYIINQSINPNAIKQGIYVNNSGKVVRKSNYATNRKIANLITNLKNRFGYNYNGFYNNGNNSLEPEVLIFNNKVRNINKNNKLKRSISFKIQPTKQLHNKAVSFLEWKGGARINRAANQANKNLRAKLLNNATKQKMQQMNLLAQQAAAKKLAENRARKAAKNKARPPNISLQVIKNIVKKSSSSTNNREKKRQAYIRQLELEEKGLK